LPALLVALGVRAADSPPGVALRVQSSLTRATVGDRLQVRVEVIHPPGVVFGEPVPVPGEGDSLILEPVKAPPSTQQEKSEVFNSGIAESVLRPSARPYRQFRPCRPMSWPSWNWNGFWPAPSFGRARSKNSMWSWPRS